MRARVDPAVCQGHTLCAMTAPEVFRLREEDGHAFVELAVLPPELEPAARRAALGCPEGAVIVED